MFSNASSRYFIIYLCNSRIMVGFAYANISYRDTITYIVSVCCVFFLFLFLSYCQTTFVLAALNNEKFVSAHSRNSPNLLCFFLNYYVEQDFFLFSSSYWFKKICSLVIIKISQRNWKVINYSNKLGHKPIIYLSIICVSLKYIIGYHCQQWTRNIIDAIVVV